MAENSHISWTDNTHNEWIGCTKVSDGCDNCYADRLDHLHKFTDEGWGKGKPRHRTSEANRRKPLKWEREAVKNGKPLRIFAQSLADNFDEEVPDEWRDDLFRTIWDTPHCTWLMLTKRMAKMLRYLASHPIPPNAWWGCSVEDQATADQRVSELLKLRKLGVTSPLWLSVEPLLGAIDLRNVNGGTLNALDGIDFEDIGDIRDAGLTKGQQIGGIDWVVVGGESGPAARPMNPEWARSLRDQCVSAGVAFHFKQWGEFAPNWYNDGNGKKIDGSEWISRMGKKMAGRELDGPHMGRISEMSEDIRELSTRECGHQAVIDDLRAEVTTLGEIIAVEHLRMHKAIDALRSIAASAARETAQPRAELDRAGILAAEALEELAP